MEFTVQNNNILYSVSFIEDIARIGVRDLSNGLYESVITLPITVWHIIEHQRQQFDTYHQRQVPITENQLGTQAMRQKYSVHISLGGRAKSKQLVHYTGGMSGIKPEGGK